MLREVFLSHASADHPLAMRLCRVLQAAGVVSWIAPRDIRPGQDWTQAIADAVRECRIMVVLISPAASNSEWVSKEVNQGRDGKLKIIPVSLDGALPRGGLALQLSLIHHLPLESDPSSAALQELVAAIVAEVRSLPRRRVGGRPLPEIREPVEQSGSPAWVIWAAVGIVVGLAGALWIVVGGGSRASGESPSSRLSPQGAAGRHSATEGVVHGAPAKASATRSPSAGMAGSADHVEGGAETERASRPPVVAPDELVNSLGMKFLPLPELPAMLCQHETRVSDFEAFVTDTGYEASEDGYSIKRGGRARRGDFWASPGFNQSANHPVVCVSWLDARAFCEWLTQKETRTGRLQPNQFYRLPTDLEWSAALGIVERPGETPRARLQNRKSEEFDWGRDFPPRKRYGNYGGEDAADNDWPERLQTIEGYRDGFPRTAPIMSFSANRLGFHDLIGNAGEWIRDRYDPTADSVRPIRGGDWAAASSLELNLHGRLVAPSDLRDVTVGFRVALELDQAPQ